MSYTKEHTSTIIKYIGISFITGAIAHGFFSGSRQILTALFGVFCFVVGTYMEEGGGKNLKVIATSAMLAIGIGAITGGFQHFPDSPERSVWIVPIGFIISLIFFGLVHEKKVPVKYAIASTVGMTILSLVLFVIIENGWLGTTHSHADSPTISMPEAIGKTALPDIPAPQNEDIPHGHD